MLRGDVLLAHLIVYLRGRTGKAGHMSWSGWSKSDHYNYQIKRVAEWNKEVRS